MKLMEVCLAYHDHLVAADWVKTWLRIHGVMVEMHREWLSQLYLLCGGT